MSYQRCLSCGLLTERVPNGSICGECCRVDIVREVSLRRGGRS